MGIFGSIIGGIMDANKAIKQNNAKNDDTVNTVTVKGLYSIDVPAFLSPRTEGAKEDSLSYSNNTLDIGMVVIDEPKQEVIEATKHLKRKQDESYLDIMARLCIMNMFEDPDKMELGDYDDSPINGLPALTLNAFQKATFFKDGLFACFGFIEGKEHFYQVVITIGGSSIEKLTDKMCDVIRTFKEL